MGGCGSLINLGLHETTVRLRSGCFNVPLRRGCSRTGASFCSSFLPPSRCHPSPLRGEGRVRGRAERNVKSCRDVGWGEPQANPNTRPFMRLATLGFASLTPTYAGVAGCNARLRPNPHPPASTFSRREKDSSLSG